MSRIFNADNAFFTFMGKLWDLVWVSILWTVTSLAIVTIGPASSALYYTVVKVIRRGRGYVTRSFFHAFKLNAKQGIITSIIYLVFGVILYIDFRYASFLDEQGNTLGTVFTVIFGVLGMMSLFILVWIFPILSRFTLNMKGLFLDAVLIAIKHFPTTFLMSGVMVGLAILVYVYQLYILYYGLFIILPCILPGLIGISKSLLVERVLKKYTPESEGTPEETGEDQWYLE